MNPRAERALGWLLATIGAVLVVPQVFTERPVLALLLPGLLVAFFGGWMVLEAGEEF